MVLECCLIVVKPKINETEPTENEEFETYQKPHIHPLAQSI